MDEDPIKIQRGYQLYATEYLMFLSYMTQKAEAEEQEDKFQEQLRKMKHK